MLLPVYVVNSSKSDPTTEFPTYLEPGDHTAKVISLGITAIIPPPTHFLLAIQLCMQIFQQHRMCHKLKQ